MARETVKLTIKNLEKLEAPTKGRRYVYDTEQPGFLVQITPTGRKSFQVYKHFKGRPIRVTIGTFPGLTPTNARDKAKEIIADLAKGIDPNERERRERQEMTFSELFEIYMERHSKINKRTWKEDQRYYDRHLTALSKKRISAITKKDIASIHGRIGQKRQVHANRVLTLISSVFGRAIEFGLWEKQNPCQGIKKFPEKSRDRFIQGHELPRFFKALSEEENTTIRDYIVISLLTGARRSNVLSMRWSEINMDSATWRIPETKNGTPQTIPLTAEVIEILMERKRETNSFFVFPGSGKSGHLVEPKKGWKRILERAGLKDLRIHDLRRTLGSWQAITGASLPIIGKSLNHKSPSTTAIYARLDIDPVRESMKKATEAMIKAAEK